MMLKTTPNFALLTPFLVKIRGSVGEISRPIPIVEALPTTEPRKYIWWSSTVQLLRAVFRPKKFMVKSQGLPVGRPRKRRKKQRRKRRRRKKMKKRRTML